LADTGEPSPDHPIGLIGMAVPSPNQQSATLTHAEWLGLLLTSWEDQATRSPLKARLRYARLGHHATSVRSIRRIHSVHFCRKRTVYVEMRRSYPR